MVYCTLKKCKYPYLSGYSPKAYGLFKVTASKFTIPKVETMRKSYYLKDNNFKVESVLEKISNVLVYTTN
jgi:hypothetical protein